MRCLSVLGLYDTYNQLRVYYLLGIHFGKFWNQHDNSALELFRTCHYFSTPFVFILDTCPMIICIHYILWLFDFALHVFSLGQVLEYPYLPPDNTRVNNLCRWRRRHRKRKPPFYKRRQSILLKHRISNQGERCPSADTSHHCDFDLCDRRCYWKYLHRTGDYLAQCFDNLCTLNPAIVSMFGAEFKFNIGCHQRKYTTEFLFHLGNELIMDMTKLSDAGHIFRFQSVYQAHHAQDKPLIFDSGASISITPDRNDFIKFSTNISGTTLSGITERAACKGRGTIKVTVLDDTGSKRDIITEALYVPAAKVKLLSVQRYCRKVKGKASFHINENGCVFTFPITQGGGTITFDLESNNMLPQTSVMKQWGRKLVKKKNLSVFTVVSADNLNLDGAQKQLLEWHYKLGHYNMNWIRSLIRQQVLPVRGQNASIASCMCQACQLSKQTRKPEGTVLQKIRPEKDGALKKNIVAVGGRVSTDQFVSSLPGRLATTFGKESVEKQYVGGTVFIDEASEYVHVENQVSLGAHETVRSKHKFEREAIRNGILIRGYRGDNGVYKTNLFKQSCQEMNQTLTFSGVGAHHHNGVAERCIRTISTCARALLLHALIHWPEQTTLDLWPFAVDYAVFLWNRMPREKSKMSPLEIFYSTKSTHEDIRSARVWGCPAYVLEPTLQDGKKLPRWRPRSKLGQFLGRSKNHASSVGLIKNVATGGVSAQFHVVYDDHFATREVNKIPEGDDIPKEWVDLFQFSREKHFDDADIVQRPPAMPQSKPINERVPISPSADNSIPPQKSGEISNEATMISNPMLKMKYPCLLFLTQNRRLLSYLHQHLHLVLRERDPNLL